MKIYTNNQKYVNGKVVGTSLMNEKTWKFELESKFPNPVDNVFQNCLKKNFYICLEKCQEF